MTAADRTVAGFQSPLTEDRFRQVCNDSFTDFFPSNGQRLNESVMAAIGAEMLSLPWQANYVLRMRKIKAHLIWGSLDLYPSLQWRPEAQKTTVRPLVGLFLDDEIFVNVSRYGTSWTPWPWLHEVGHAVSFLCGFTNEVEQPDVLATHKSLVNRNALRVEEAVNWNEWVAQAIARRYLGVVVDKSETEFWTAKLTKAGVA